MKGALSSLVATIAFFAGTMVLLLSINLENVALVFPFAAIGLLLAAFFLPLLWRRNRAGFVGGVGVGIYGLVGYAGLMLPALIREQISVQVTLFTAAAVVFTLGLIYFSATTARTYGYRVMTSNGRLVLGYGVVVVILLLVSFPIFWMISASFKNNFELQGSTQLWFSARPSLVNYFQIFSTPRTVEAIVNSVIVGISATVLTVLVGFPAAYAISRVGAGLRWLFVFTLIPLLLPPIVLAMPGLVFFTTIGLANSVLGLTLFYVVITVFFVVWMTKPFIDSVPRELEDMALLEGVSRYKIPFTVVLPLVKGGLTAAALFVFVLNWTEFLFALVLNHNQAPTIPVQLNTFRGSSGAFEGPVSALGTLSLVPFFIFVYYFQKHMLKGLTFGALKIR